MLNITKEITVRGRHTAHAGDRLHAFVIYNFGLWEGQRLPVNTDTVSTEVLSRPYEDDIDEACDTSREIYLLGIVLKSMSHSKLSDIYWLHQWLKGRAFQSCTFGCRRLLSTNSCDERRFSWHGLLSTTQNPRCLFFLLSFSFCPYFSWHGETKTLPPVRVKTQGSICNFTDFVTWLYLII